MRIAGREVGDGCPCYVVAELGINHNGDLQIAKQLIDAACIAGCDAVKFQKRTIGLVYTEGELAEPRESPFGHTNGDLKCGLEFGFEQYVQIDQYCREKGIPWFASPWDLESVKFLQQFDPPAYKVPSALLPFRDLILALCANERPIIVSTGMSNLRDVVSAVSPILNRNVPLGLLACVSAYPCAVADLHLARIRTLQNMFGHEAVIGYSGHEVGVWTTLCAVAMGAKIVERHITLDRAMWGTDQAASLEVPGLIKLVREIRDYERALGDGRIKCLDCEQAMKSKLRRRWPEI